ncbi:hypothetical protein Tco_1391491 [Tanacetum coccineum]
MASQDARLSKFEADFKRQQGEMTNKIDTVLKAITDQIAGTLPSDMEERHTIFPLKKVMGAISETPKDTIQAMIDADEQLAAKLQAEEQEQFSIEEKSRMLVEMIVERKKFFAAQRASKQRSKPPTKNQIRNRMCTYLKNIGGYKHNQLKERSYEEIQKLFDRAYKQVSLFVPMDSEVVKSSVTRTEGSSKRARDELESDKSKKQKIDEHIEVEKDDQEEAEIKRHTEIVKDDEVAIDAIPLATKPLVIVEYKIDKDGRMGYFKLIRADGSSKRYSSMIKMLQDIDREDLETLWKLVKAKHENTRPEEDYERVLWGDLKVMFELDIKREEQASAFKPIVSLHHNFIQAKDKGTGKMLEKERVAHQEAIREAVIEELDSIHAMIDADEELAAKLQAEEQEQFSIEENTRMLVEMIVERKKFFAAQRAAKQKVSSFVPMDSEVVKSSVTRTEGSSKRAGDELESNKSNKQKIDEHIEAEKDDQPFV